MTLALIGFGIGVATGAFLQWWRNEKILSTLANKGMIGHFIPPPSDLQKKD